MGNIVPASNTEVKARLHWIPPWVDKESIEVSLAQIGVEVVSLTPDRSTIPKFVNSEIRVWTAILRGDRDDMPHIFKVYDECMGDEIDSLVTITGRKPYCFRCKGEGHIRSKCTASFCYKCKRLGHSPSESMGENYATIA